MTGPNGNGTQPLLAMQGVEKHFELSKGLIVKKKIGAVKAVDGVSLELHEGETLAVVGESGCGKSTLGRLALRLLDPTGGRILYRGQDIGALSKREMRALRREMQIIFQDPFASLNPRLTVADTLGEPLNVHRIATGAKRKERIEELLRLVGLSPWHMVRYPHEFSGGQRQRIGIARALAGDPKLIVCDEPVSALDVSIQAQVINLLMDLQRRFGLAFLFISHDMAVVKHVSHRVAVMYLGQLVEVADKADLFARPRHPYTQALLSAVPLPEPGAVRRRIVLEGDVPSPISPPEGCRFHTRCAFATDRCRQEAPTLADAAGADDGGQRRVACFNWKAVAAARPYAPPTEPTERPVAQRLKLYREALARDAAVSVAAQ